MPGVIHMVMNDIPLKYTGTVFERLFQILGVHRVFHDRPLLCAEGIQQFGSDMQVAGDKAPGVRAIH